MSITCYELCLYKLAPTYLSHYCVSPACSWSLSTTVCWWQRTVYWACVLERPSSQAPRPRSVPWVLERPSSQAPRPRSVPWVMERPSSQAPRPRSVPWVILSAAQNWSFFLFVLNCHMHHCPLSEFLLNVWRWNSCYYNYYYYRKTLWWVWSSVHAITGRQTVT